MRINVMSNEALLLVILIVVTLCNTSQGDKCFPERTWEGRTYRLITEPGNYARGEKACRHWNGRLAEEPINIDISKFVLEAFEGKEADHPDVWLGFNKKKDEEAVVEKDDRYSGSYCPSFKTKARPHETSYKRDHCEKHKMALCVKRYVNKVDSFPNDSCLPSVGACSHGYATFDGSCNNKLDKFRGVRERALKRLLPAAYDRKTDPRGTAGNLPSPRAVTNAIRDVTNQNSSAVTNMLVTFGQMLAHDLTRTDLGSVPCNCTSTDTECFNIAIADNDPMKEEFQCLNFTRSKSVANVNCKTKHVREQENLESAYIDASFVYGSTTSHAAALRAPASQPGKMLAGNFTSPDPESLPLESAVVGTDVHMECPAIHKPVNTPCFAAGDARATENPMLASDHTAFLRLHNRIVDQLEQLNPSWGSDKLYQTARKIVAAVVQQIAYNEFLPTLLGPNLMKFFGLGLTRDGFYYGYNAIHDATIANSVATAALRLHTLVVNAPTLRNDDFGKLSDIPLPSNFFSTLPFTMNDATGQIFRGAAFDPTSKYDLNIVTALIDKLFKEDDKNFGTDLNALNIQRGRDHGIPSYLNYRHFCGLKKDLSDIPASAQAKLRSVYNNDEDIDLFPGGNAERPVDGGVVGPTMGCILAYQFRDLKRGDINWHENGGPVRAFTQAQLRSIKRMTLARLLCDTSNSTVKIQPKVMLQQGPNNTVVDCDAIPQLDLTPWKKRAKFGTEHYELEYTSWLPVRPASCGKKLPLAAAVAVLRHAAVYRPDAVCKRVLGHQMEKVNGHYRVRFACPAGSIMETDYPTVDAQNEYFTPWVNQRKPSKKKGGDDIEALSGSAVCRYPVAIQAQTTDGEPCRATGDIFEVLSPQHGLVCRGFQQASGRCKDYRVRYVCQKDWAL